MDCADSENEKGLTSHALTEMLNKIETLEACTFMSQQKSSLADLNSDLPNKGKAKGKIGRPRTKPLKEKVEWHYHLGGVRHSRVPLSPDIKEVLEVAYTSKIMSKNFRKEGQPEKERLAQITGIELDKIQEWFKNRRKKERH